MKCRFSLFRKSSGLTVVELLIAVTLSMMIMAGAASIFMGSKETFRLEEGISRQQENLRFISDQFLKEFSMAGHTGCGISVVAKNANYFSTVAGPGMPEGSVPPMIVGVEGGADPDSVTVRYALLETGVPVLNPGGEADPVVVSTASGLYQSLSDNFSKAADDQVPVVLMLSNCYSTDMFLATGVAADPADASLGNIAHAENKASPIGGFYNYDAAFSYSYGRLEQSTSTVYQVGSVTYSAQAFIENGKTLYNLRLSRNGANAETIVSGLEDFQVEYGLDSSGKGDSNRYVEWTDVGASESVSSLKFTLKHPLRDKEDIFIIKLRNA